MKYNIVIITDNQKGACVRAQAEELRRQNKLIVDAPYISHILNALPNFVSILNSQRQVVFVNRALEVFLGLDPQSDLPDVRMGEALDCRFAWADENGCGESEHCSMCGANQAVRSALKNKSCSKDCTLRVKSKGGLASLNFLVIAEPLRVAGALFVLFTAVDMEGQRRKRCLENVFFREVLTLSSSIRGIAQSLNELAPEGLDSITETLYLASDNLVDEIETQRDLLAAEAGELKVTPKNMRTLWFLQKVREKYDMSLAADGKGLEVDPESVDEPFCSDPLIFKRAFMNLIKNALENTPVGGTTQMGCRDVGEKLEFWVKNQAEIPWDVQLQVFNRFFSTKSNNSGSGTYSSQLLVENYLQGEIDFSSGPNVGTEFRVRLPRSI